MIENETDLTKIKSDAKGAYLGRTSDGTGLSKEANTTLQTLLGTGLTTGKKATIKPTGSGWLRVRDAPSLNGLEITKVDEGQTFVVWEEKTEWVKIKVNDTTQGWVYAQYVDIAAE